MKKKTGVCPAVFDLVLRSCKKDLTALHGGKVHQDGKLLQTAPNQLLLYLNHLKEDPTDPQLAQDFDVVEKDVLRIIIRLSEVVGPVLAEHVKKPRRINHIIQTGFLVGAAFEVDATNTPVLRPGVGQGKDRKRFYDGKNRDWGVKVQVMAGLDAKIWDCSQAVPCSISDQELFEESHLPEMIEVAGFKGVGDAHYVRREGVYGTKKGSVQSVTHKDYNQEIENIRAYIENVNKRLKDWKVLKGPWRRDRHNLDLFSTCAMSVCGLLNLQIDNGEPVWKGISGLMPRIANPRHNNKVKSKAKALEAK